MQWQKKLYQHEENPPPFIWDDLTKVLADEPYNIRQSLNEYSVTPPSNIWDNISTKIGDEETPVTIPLHYKIRNSSALSYAAAITGIGLFIALIVFLLNNKPNEIGVKDLAAGLNFQDSPLSESNKDTNQEIQNNQPLTQPAEDNIISENNAAFKKPIASEERKQTLTNHHKTKIRKKLVIQTAIIFWCMSMMDNLKGYPINWQIWSNPCIPRIIHPQHTSRHSAME